MEQITHQKSSVFVWCSRRHGPGMGLSTPRAAAGRGETGRTLRPRGVMWCCRRRSPLRDARRRPRSSGKFAVPAMTPVALRRSMASNLPRKARKRRRGIALKTKKPKRLFVGFKLTSWGQYDLGPSST